MQPIDKYPACDTVLLCLLMDFLMSNQYAKIRLTLTGATTVTLLSIITKLFSLIHLSMMLCKKCPFCMSGYRASEFQICRSDY